MMMTGSDKTVPKGTEKKETEQKREYSAAVVEIHKLLHTLYHPLITFAGKSKTLFHTLDLLHQTMPPLALLPTNSLELARQLMSQLLQLKESLLGNKELEPLLRLTLEEKLTPIIYVFDYTLKTEKDKVILDSKIMDTATWVLEELKEMNYFQEDNLKPFIKIDFIEFLQGILLHYLKLDAAILMAETEMMNRQVESLRTYIGLEKLHKYSFTRHDLKRILEENIRMFGPLLAEKGIDIDVKITGNLAADISKLEIDRVLSNLFRNVINYSFKGQGRFVNVTASELQPQNTVEISIENLSLPIKKEEIDSGALFKYGTRGAFAYKGDHDGLGVGLADAKDVIEVHGGEISLTSKPVADGGNPPEYKVPYITKITVSIPKSRKRKE